MDAILVLVFAKVVYSEFGDLVYFDVASGVWQRTYFAPSWFKTVADVYCQPVNDLYLFF